MNLSKLIFQKSSSYKSQKLQEEADLQKAIQVSIEESRNHLSKSKTRRNDLNSKCSSLLATDETTQNITVPTPVSVLAPALAPAPAQAQQENLLLDFFSEQVATSAPGPILASKNSENLNALV